MFLRCVSELVIESREVCLCSPPSGSTYEIINWVFFCTAYVQIVMLISIAVFHSLFFITAFVLSKYVVKYAQFISLLLSPFFLLDIYMDIVWYDSWEAGERWQSEGELIIAFILKTTNCTWIPMERWDYLAFLCSSSARMIAVLDKCCIFKYQILQDAGWEARGVSLWQRL